MRKLYTKYQQIISYLFFGVATTVVNWIVYTICIVLLHMTMTTSNGIAWFVAVLFAYITNKRYVFQSRQANFLFALKEFILFVGARIFSGIFEIFLPSVFFYVGLDQSIMGIKGFVAKLVTSILVVLLNYFLSKWIIFKKSSKEEIEKESSSSC